MVYVLCLYLLLTERILYSAVYIMTVYYNNEYLLFYNSLLLLKTQIRTIKASEINDIKVFNPNYGTAALYIM